MRGWSSVFLGLLLFAGAAWMLSAGGFGSLTLFCGAAGLFLIIRGAQGLGVGEAGDPTALVDFVTNPAGAIVDTATDRIGDWFKAKPAPAPVAEKEGFDPDAVIERYLAQRGTELPALSAIPADNAAMGITNAAPARSFGRKGV
jgi:hypothetical protein